MAVEHQWAHHVAGRQQTGASGWSPTLSLNGVRDATAPFSRGDGLFLQQSAGGRFYNGFMY
jgi:hypothetical protein